MNKTALDLALDAALLNAQAVIDFNPSSYRGYQLKHAALHGAQRYDEAIATFEIMLFKLENSPDTQIQNLRQHYLSPSEAEGAIRTVIHTQLDDTPLRVFDTTTGLLCDREAQISVFKTSTGYNELLSFTMNHADLPIGSLQKMVEMSFGYVMLFHRWEGKEPLLHDIQNKVLYELDAVGGILKLQSFCKIAREAGYRWAWSDTCCIDKNDDLELQQSFNSMFVWYRRSALTIVYLADVTPSSTSGALANSEWNRRGWTVVESLAPKSVAIMRELGRATGIDPSALVAFHPGMGDAREKLQWASTRITTLQEDIAYSFFGIFGVHLPVIYGEKKHSALRRLLQEIVTRSGDITALDWVGKSSEFNSCLPADITSYKAPPSTFPSLTKDEMQKSVSVLRNTVTVELASEFYTLFDQLSAPRFADCRLHLPCITFRVTAVRRRRGQGQETTVTYEVQADGLCDLLITTEDKPSQFSGAMDTKQTLLLVRPWSRYFLELPDSALDEMKSLSDWSIAPSSLDNLAGTSRSHGSRFIPCLGHFFGSFFDALHGVPEKKGVVYSESHLQALRFIVRLGQPFSAFLLAQQPGGEYKRIASDRNIIARVKDTTTVRSMMDVRTLEIL
ncbi:uncharacterized protein EDB91DRAFT_1280284 [Suillus paluster]|uniref:uncharacterized protein n=1 Tax=Suillus paluster TaxID=48578 RepID=UPI001B86BDD5|nr:uncharacterized protein EDB91DRAFT_1280284 [Suillus paluster]KAG1741888.1 hypothetical protein EDB91DRAFT_1280284 [Suillus paluster]